MEKGAPLRNLSQTWGPACPTKTPAIGPCAYCKSSSLSLHNHKAGNPRFFPRTTLAAFCKPVLTLRFSIPTPKSSRAVAIQSSVCWKFLLLLWLAIGLYNCNSKEDELEQLTARTCWKERGIIIENSTQCPRMYARKRGQMITDGRRDVVRA